MSVNSGRPLGSDDNETPEVAIRGGDWVLPMAIAAALGLGGVVFWQLNENRTRQEQARLTDPVQDAQPISISDVPPPPDLSNLSALVSEAAPRSMTPEEEAALFGPAPGAAPMPPGSSSPEEAARLKAPSLVVDLSEAGAAPAPAGPAGASNPLTPGMAAQRIGGGRIPDAANKDEEFAARFATGGGEGPIRAGRMGDHAQTIPEGAVIAGVLETALNSDLPGYVRAIVSRDVRSFDGANVLAPRGSRLIGQYRSGVALGQSRAFVIWTKLVRPDGVTIDLAAPGADALGRGGLEGQVDRHFLRRFGGAILLSLITAGVNAAATDSDTQVIIAGSRGVGDAASTALSKELDIAPTVKVPPGTPIRIIVTRDLDFSSVADTAP
jgi:type IV secretion system protein VirB10